MFNKEIKKYTKLILDSQTFDSLKHKNEPTGKQGGWKNEFIEICHLLRNVYESDTKYDEFKRSPSYFYRRLNKLNHSINNNNI